MLGCPALQERGGPLTPKFTAVQRVACNSEKAAHFFNRSQLFPLRGRRSESQGDVLLFIPCTVNEKG